jgi:NADH dehydrogenase/NADH:ubiquinone oxidoreductase subunit G
MIKLSVNDTEIEVNSGISLLQACLENDIYIPHLCHIDERETPEASCRMCFVEIDGIEGPVTSCSCNVAEGMVVRTDTVEIRRLQRTGLKLLLSVHKVECGKCPANKKCELQHIAKFLKVGLKPKRLERLLEKPDLIGDHPFFDYFPNRCVLCGKCVYACRTLNNLPLLTYAKRGFETIISFYGHEEGSELPCEDCEACVEICPVGAIIRKV